MLYNIKKGIEGIYYQHTSMTSVLSNATAYRAGSYSKLMDFHYDQITLLFFFLCHYAQLMEPYLHSRPRE